MEIKLIVIRTENPNKLVHFYSLLGLLFEQHKHDKGPVHFAASVGNATFEIYPLSKSQVAPDPFFRMGITIDNFEEKILLLQEQSIIFHAGPEATEFGYRAVIEDPEGRKIELYKT